MNQPKLLALLAAAVIALAGGWYFGTATQPSRLPAIDAGKLMFPDLTGKLKDARRIEAEIERLAPQPPPATNAPPKR